MKSLGLLGVSVVATALLAGCATDPNAEAAGGVADQSSLADSSAAFGTQQTDWDTPFWEKWIEKARSGEGSTAGTSAAPASRPAATAAVAAAATTPGVATAAQTASPAVVQRSQLRSKVGVYIAGDEGDSLVAYQFVNALEHKAAINGVSIVKPDTLADALSEPGVCSSKKAIECVRSLAIYPGIRALLVVTPKRVSRGDSRMTVETRMIDTDFGVEYDPIHTSVSLASDGETDSGDLGIWSDRMLGLVQDRIGIAPWFTHSFALDGEDMYVSAGRDSGLAAGSHLNVREGGSVVRAPGGRVVAWKPGPVVGEIKVKQFIGPDLAIAEQVSGQRPAPRDKLTATE